MIYMSPQTRIAPGISERFGQILTPISGTRLPERVWCADNGVFTGQFNEDAFFRWLDRMEAARHLCLFVTVPDSVANAIETQYKFRHYAWKIKAKGWPVAFVAQDGQESLPFPPEYDALFIGGSTEWKMSKAADWCVRKAQEGGRWVHAGRVNSIRRIRHFQLIGVDSADGTTIAYAPDEKYPLLLRALLQPPLMEV